MAGFNIDDESERIFMERLFSELQVEEDKRIEMLESIKVEINKTIIMSKTKEGFLNETELEFDDISSEKEREYGFPNGNTLYIGKPLYLNVSKSGGHRLYTEDKWCYYVQPKESWWIRWRVKEGQPNFVK